MHYFRGRISHVGQGSSHAANVEAFGQIESAREIKISNSDDLDILQLPYRGCVMGTDIPGTY